MTRFVSVVFAAEKIGFMTRPERKTKRVRRSR